MQGWQAEACVYLYTSPSSDDEQLFTTDDLSWLNLLSLLVGSLRWSRENARFIDSIRQPCNAGEAHRKSWEIDGVLCARLVFSVDEAADDDCVA